MVNYVFLSVYFYSVPNLRFSFEEDWCTSTIGENFRLSSGLTPSTKEKAYFNNGIIPWINSGELKNKYISFTENKLTLDAVKKHNLTIYPMDTMVIAIYGLEAAGVRGKASITKMDSTISQSCMAFNSLGNVLTQFMYYVYKKEAQILGTRYAQGTKQQNLSSDLLSSYKLLYPSKEEQLKIVNFLSLIDEKIETQSKIIEEYVILKNSLIHRFFTMDNPKVKLSTILTEINIKNKNKQIDTVLSVSNKLGFIKQSEQFEDREVASDDTSNYKIVNKGDYAYNPARINVGSIARLINYDKGIISPMYSCFKINEKKITYTYFDMFLSSFSFKRQLNKKLEGSVRQCLTFEGMLSMDIELPCIETQKSISNKIDMLNYKIKLESDYREALIKQKQFLLNNMFI